jgi:thiol-disulfide isomerase/thioredoxin
MTMMLRQLVGCLLLCLWTGSCSAEYSDATPHKAVVHLGGDSFDQAIKDPANPFWFLKFYAPWYVTEKGHALLYILPSNRRHSNFFVFSIHRCGHCKRMAPVLDNIAPKLEGKMAIGKIDCTIHKALCKKFSIRGYPTLKYSVDGALTDYSGGRDEAALTAFAEKMSGPPVHVALNYEEALKYAKEQTPEGVAFLGFDPRSSPEDMSQFQLIFNQVARQQQASAYFVWLVPDQEERNYQFMHKIEANIRPKSYESHDVDITAMNTESLTAWVKANNMKLVTELGPSNFGRIGKSGRPLALSVVDFENEAQKKAIKDHMISYATSLSPKEMDKYYFGIIDGTKFAKFLEQFNVMEAENPQMVVVDVPTKTFWQNSTYKNMVEFVKAIDDGEIEVHTASKPTKKGFLGKVESLFVDNFPYSIIVVLLFVFGLVFLLVPSGDDMLAPYDRVPDDGEVIGDDDGAAASENKKDK